MGKRGNKNVVLALSFLLAIAAVGASTSCRQTAAPPSIDKAAHANEIQKWQSERLASLTKDDGWLTLIGLFWLDDGANTFGSDSKNKIVLPNDRAPKLAGELRREGDHIKLMTLPGTELSVVTSKGEVLKADDLVPTPQFELKADTDESGPTIIKLGSLLMNIIKRGDRVGLRVKDTASRTRQEFKGLEYYPIDPKWRIEARVEPYQPNKKIPITNVLGMTEDSESPGALVFEVDGKTYRLDPILEQGEPDWFVMIADETTGKETYGAGRYLYVKPADASGKVVIDFNKAYSPPCAFTNFATCPLPPKQNRLPIRVDAGEKKYAGTVH